MDQIDKKFYTKEDLQTVLNISEATINNWFKTGLIPGTWKKKVFSKREFSDLINYLSSSTKLKGRANRSLADSNSICYLGITSKERRSLLNDAVQNYRNLAIEVEEGVFSLALAALRSAGLLAETWFKRPKSKLDFFLISWAKEKQINITKALKYFEDFYIPNLNDDFMGAFYQSVQSVAAKSKRGSFYTPASLLQDIQLPLDKKILDPCCGSGSILLQVLNPDHDSKQIFAWDIDATALKICRVNLTLFFKDPNITPHIELYDSIFANKTTLTKETEQTKFDYIITNPPWGSKFNAKQKRVLLQKYPELGTYESFSIVLFNSLRKLAPNGLLIFFLPHSFLNVTSHANIRKYLAKKGLPMKIILLGNSFQGVMSEAIRLEIKNTKVSPPEIKIFRSHEQQPTVISNNTFQVKNFIIPATASNVDLDLMNKIYSCKHLLLENNAKFALGIVTGNNKQHLLSRPTPNSEPIYRGKDIDHFKFLNPVFYLEFNPDKYQQVAPLELYRQPKIVYRFIADKLVCALDKQGRLLLNSANLFIPTLDYPLETIVSLFNSKLYTYLYRKMYYSKKVLRNHLESLPLPLLNSKQHALLKEIHDNFYIYKDSQESLNHAVYSFFDLTVQEIRLIEDL
ncbi:MAG: N-6 DNA methylase [Peptococcaceae bacterium]|nr:N-6 DNA methylase [Peptococcaceae bacterium]